MKINILLFLILCTPLLGKAQESPMFVFKGHNYGISSLTFRKNSDILTVVGNARGGVTNYDVGTGTRSGYATAEGGKIDQSVHSLDGRYSAILSHYSQYLTVFDNDSSKMIFTLFSKRWNSIAFSPDNRFLITNLGEYIDVNTGKIIKKLTSEFKMMPSTAFQVSSDGNQLIFVKNNIFTMVTLADTTKKVEVKLPVKFGFDVSCINVDEKTNIAIIGFNNLWQPSSPVVVIDIKSKAVLHFITTPYVAILDAKVSPDLQSFAYSGKVDPSMGADAIKVIHCDLKSKTPLLSISAHDNVGVGAIAYSSDSRYLATGGFASSYKLQGNTFEIQPTGYPEVDVKVWNLDQVAKRKPTQNVFSPKLNGKNTKGPQVYAVIVGISKYPFIKDFNLDYADLDAQKYYQFLISQAGGSVPPANIAFFNSKTGSKDQILGAIKSQFSKAVENDQIIFYYAGHALPDGDASELYLLSNNSKTDNLFGTAISQFEIERMFNKSTARHKLWITDACHSGALGGVKLRGSKVAAVNSLITKLAQSIEGVAIFSASSSTEFSQENTRWGGGQGVFSYYMMKGLKGAADNDHDKFVTIRELYDYVYANVAKDTKGDQHPELKGRFDNSMPLSYTVSVINPVRKN